MNWNYHFTGLIKKKLIQFSGYHESCNCLSILLQFKEMYYFGDKETWNV